MEALIDALVEWEAQRAVHAWSLTYVDTMRDKSSPDVLIRAAERLEAVLGPEGYDAHYRVLERRSELLRMKAWP